DDANARHQMVMPEIQQLVSQAGYGRRLPLKQAVIEKKDFCGAQKLLIWRGGGAQNLRSGAGLNSAPLVREFAPLSRGTMEEGWGERDGRNPQAKHLRYSVGARLCL